jgi:cytochrome b561
VLLHVAATIWHLVIRRDGLLERMLPVQDGRGSR